MPQSVAAFTTKDSRLVGGRGCDVYQSGVVAPLRVLGQPTVFFKNRMPNLKLEIFFTFNKHEMVSVNHVLSFRAEIEKY